MISTVDQYMYFGYLPSIARADIAWLGDDADYDPAAGEKKDLAWWVQEGVREFKETMTRELAGTPEKATHVVPLSGGLDSRAILGALQEHLPQEQIVTATFGIPGAWDFEIGRVLAKKYNVYHQEINLLEEEWDLDQLVAAGARLYNPVNVFEAYVNQKIRDCFGPGCVYWSGMSAGSLAGAHCYAEPSTDKKQAIKRFLSYNNTPHFRDQAFQDEIIHMIFAEFPWKDASQTPMSMDMQMDFGIRQRYFIRPILLEEGFDIKTPFLSKPWLNFILHAPYPWLLDEHLYKQVLMAGYPDLFKLHVRNNYGLPLTAPGYQVFLSKVMARIIPRIVRKDPYASHPRTKYINFTEALRHTSKFQTMVYAALQDFKKRGIYHGAEIDGWWTGHVNRRMDCTALLINLASLEILMKAGKI